MANLRITPEDLTPFAEIPQAKAEAMIADALAWARRVAPCIDDPSFEHPEFALAIIRGAILRWNDAGSGAVTQVGQTAGPFGLTQAFQQPQRRNLFRPDELDELRKLCESTSGKAWSYDTVGSGSIHADVCSLRFGALFCSCGADLAGTPLWENQ